jgi:rhodanese-related sulfurtransferase
VFVNLKALPKMLSMIPSVFGGVGLRDLETIKAIARQAYPSVPQLSTETLAEWMERAGSALLLIDVRSPDEFAVSHLRGAINLQRPEQIASAIEENAADRTILYCSVGFRSSRLAYALAEKGKVSNLEGSIFQWANEGRAVFQGERLVEKIHPYGKRWAGLLKPGLASEC